MLISSQVGAAASESCPGLKACFIYIVLHRAPEQGQQCGRRQALWAVPMGDDDEPPEPHEKLRTTKGSTPLNRSLILYLTYL